MASPGQSHGSPQEDKQAIDDLLMCPVCLEPFKDPKTLSCLHTFCSGCLEQCRRPYRREITCPVCKKSTALPPTGIQGLQNDFRIQQIKDILQKQHVSPVNIDEPMTPSLSSDPVINDCDLCKAHQKQSSAKSHCAQCSMYFCEACIDRHQKNSLFSGHHVIDISSNVAGDLLFCKNHSGYALRYFCSTCNTMLCTVCTMEHDESHAQVTLDKSIVEKYNQNMHGLLKVINCKLNEITNNIKYLDTVKQTYKKALYDVQMGIHQRASEIVAEIRAEEKSLIEEAQSSMETKMKEMGLEHIVELNFHKANLESLQVEIKSAIEDSPQNYLVLYNDLKEKISNVHEMTLPTVHSKKHTVKAVQYVPKSDITGKYLGTLKEGVLSEEIFSGEPPDMSPTDNTWGKLMPNFSRGKSIVPKRTSSILNAISPNKGEVKIGKVKAFSSQPEKPKINAINADSLIEADQQSTSNSVDNLEPIPSTSAAPSAPPSPTSDHKRVRKDQATLIYKIDQVGGWPGKIMSPSSVAFLPDGSVVVAECDNRLQLFDANGQWVRVIGWGKIRPQGVTVTAEGQIAITDKKDKCVKVFLPEGDCVAMWGNGLFSYPAGIACTSNGNFVVADVDRHMVSVHNNDGSLLTQFGCWGSGDYQFNSPTYLAVSKDEDIIVSDSCNGCIKIFDKKGMFIRKFSSSSSHVSDLLRRPQGLCIENKGNILVADRENHCISMFSMEGTFIRHILSRVNGLKYPIEVRAGPSGQIAVVECHNGFPTKEPHHAVKLYKL